MFQTKVVEKIKTHLCSIAFFPEDRDFYEIMWTNIVGPDLARTSVYDACALHAGYQTLPTHTQNL